MNRISQVIFLISTVTLTLTCCTGYSGHATNRHGIDEAGFESKPDVTFTAFNNETAIDQLLASFQSAYNTHNPSEVAVLYAENARWLAAAGPVIEGRKTIRVALEQFMTFVPPILTLTEGDKVIIRNYAVSRGTYTMTGEVDGESRSIGGSYLSVFGKAGEDWQIIAQHMNYDFEMSPDMWVGQPKVVEALSEDGALMALAETCEAHSNAGDVLMMSKRFTEDAWVSFGGSSWVTGREAVAQSLQAGMEKSLRLDIHDVSTLPLGDGMAVDVGWYEFTVNANRVQWGTYSLLAQQNPEGEWRIHWLIGTGSPYKKE